MIETNSNSFFGIKKSGFKNLQFKFITSFRATKIEISSNKNSRLLNETSLVETVNSQIMDF